MARVRFFQSSHILGRHASVKKEKCNSAFPSSATSFGSSGFALADLACSTDGVPVAIKTFVAALEPHCKFNVKLTFS